MIERVEQRFELKPERLIGDMAYGAADLLGWMVNEVDRTTYPGVGQDPAQR